MPLTPSFGDRRIGPIKRIYRAVEKKILLTFGKTVMAGPGWGLAWLYLAISRLIRFRKRVEKIMDDTTTEVIPAVDEAIRGAWRDGERAARGDIPGSRPTLDGSDRGLVDIIDATTATIRRAHEFTPPALEASYREVVDAAIRTGETGEEARKNAVRRALEAFARRGITGFVDSRGRRYDLPTYVELAVRAAITRAEVDAYCTQVTQAGHDVVVVSDVPGACDRCRPFEGAVLSISGSTVGAITRHSSTGQAVRVRVLCSIAEARARGLWHPACRHTLSIWTPDDPSPPRVTRVPDEVRARRRRQNALARRARQQERVNFVARL